MCGIAGIADFGNPGGASETSVKKMTALLAHRGPDGDGFHFDSHIGLGHRRLKVIDLEGGAQPMTNEDGSLWVIYNGEIYNFIELADELRKSGHVFRTRCDTEVILHAYEQWGENCLARFNGMFAFALWDSKKRRLFIARDRLGVKPFFYAQAGARFVFASELRALLPALHHPPEVDAFGMTSYLLTQYVPAPRTIFKNIYKLKPGHAAFVDESGMKQWRWWSVPDDEVVSAPGHAAEKLVELLEDAVRIRLISDVPLGAFLSGGVDSSAVVGLMSRHADEPVRTFQVAFEEPPGYDETPFAALAAKNFGAKHERLVMNPADLSELFPLIARGMGEPVADPALIPTYMVSKLARQFVTVVLTGEGADELFGGYQRYSLERLTRPWRLAPGFVRNAARAIVSLKGNSGRILKGIDALNAAAGAERHLAWVRVFSKDELDALLPEEEYRQARAELLEVFSPCFKTLKESEMNPLADTLRCDVGTWLPDDLLAKVDYMSMAHGLEARVPYLDYRLVEWAFRLPDGLKIRGRTRKAVLKEAVAPIVPREIVERGKWGFTLPIEHWFRGPLRDYVHDTIGQCSDRLPLDKKAALGWVDEHERKIDNHSAKLFSIMMITNWLKGL